MISRTLERLPLRDQGRGEGLGADSDEALEGYRAPQRKGAFTTVLHHPSRGIKTLVHGDDYTSSGSNSELDCLEEQLSKRYKIKTQRLRDAEGQREVRILNRIVRVIITPQGCEMEADPRHAELIT